jgi:hypothetical protein
MVAGSSPARGANNFNDLVDFKSRLAAEDVVQDNDWDNKHEDSNSGQRVRWRRDGHMPLFDESWATTKAAIQETAVQQVRSANREFIFDPGLAGQIDDIVNSRVPKVATLRPEQRRGKRIEIRPGYSVVDVSIPFVGDEKSFHLAPTRTSIPSVACQMQPDHLLIRFEDDDKLDQRVDTFAQAVSHTLDSLRAEVAAWVPQFRAALSAAAAARSNEFLAQQQRDKGRSFPID